jgi:pimeloyl-ACP methyl ester carboxylesterase
MVRDGLEVVEYVLRTLQPASGRVLLVGHSWGSALGVHMLKRRPELFAAFVGAAQLVNMRENEDYNYRWALRRAQELGNTVALEALRALGAPPFSELRTLREWSDRLAEGDGDPVLPSPSARPADFGRDDVPPMMAGAEFSSRQLLPELFKVDLPALGLEFGVPMFFFHGTCDHHTPMELAERYCASISAPHKEFVRFEACHHFVVMNRPDEFLRKLVARVLPHI